MSCALTHSRCVCKQHQPVDMAPRTQWAVTAHQHPHTYTKLAAVDEVGLLSEGGGRQAGECVSDRGDEQRLGEIAGQLLG